MSPKFWGDGLREVSFGPHLSRPERKLGWFRGRMFFPENQQRSGLKRHIFGPAGSKTWSCFPYEWPEAIVLHDLLKCPLVLGLFRYIPCFCLLLDEHEIDLQVHLVSLGGKAGTPVRLRLSKGAIQTSECHDMLICWGQPMSTFQRCCLSFNQVQKPGAAGTNSAF